MKQLDDVKWEWELKVEEEETEQLPQATSYVGSIFSDLL